ncbi:hypothetical protein GCM10022267_83390 [Lentzea roselyniae]|uniref:Secreted protein n=1 Tax=Lentzea roselyniae TaxID=531940 RepID=A0ABP7CDQ0_9PSEU
MKRKRVATAAAAGTVLMGLLVSAQVSAAEPSQHAPQAECKSGQVTPKLKIGAQKYQHPRKDQVFLRTGEVWPYGSCIDSKAGVSPADWGQGRACNLERDGGRWGREWQNGCSAGGHIVLFSKYFYASTEAFGPKEGEEYWYDSDEIIRIE